MERAILYNTFGKTKCVGFQHSALGKNFLNYVFKPGELREHWDNRQNTNSMPLPDYILTSGELGSEFMLDAGYPESNVAVVGAVRFRSLFEYRKQMLNQNELRTRYAIAANKKVIFVAPSPLLQETVCMLDDLLSAIRGAEGPFHIIVKCHPDAVGIPGYTVKVKEVLKVNEDASSFDFFTEPIALYDYIRLSDALLVAGGTVALEAIVLGCVPIIYTNRTQFSHNPMTAYSNAAIIVDDSESMRAALNMLKDSEAVDRIKQAWDKPIRDNFYDASEITKERFLAVLRNDFGVM